MEHEKHSQGVATSEVLSSETLTEAIAVEAYVAHQEDHNISKWQSVKLNPKAVAWCFFIVWSTLLVSFEGQAGGAITGITEFRKDFGSPYDGNWVLPANWQSAYTGGPLVSGIAGALSAGVIAEYFGRKWTLIGCLVLSYVAITVEMVATTNAQIFGGKFINGFSTTIMATVNVTYIGEIVPLALRGLMTCAIALAYTVGPFTSGLIVLYTGTTPTRWAYRAVFCSQYGFAAVTSAFIFFLPESPWWLAVQGKPERALQSLRRLGYTNGEEVKRLAVIKTTLEEAKKESSGVTYLECFRKSNLRRTIISIMPLSIQANGGVIFIASFSTYYFELAGYTTFQAFELNVIGQVLSMVGNIMSWSLIDRFGRRPLILWGTIMLTVLLCVVGGLAAAGTQSTIKGAVALILVYNFLYNITIGSSAYTLLTEVATARLRTKTVAIGIAVQYAWYVLWSFTLPYLFNPNEANLGAKISFIYGGISVFCCIYLYFYQPETKARSYEELDEMFAKKIPAADFKDYVTEVEMKGKNEVERRQLAH